MSPNRNWLKNPFARWTVLATLCIAAAGCSNGSSNGSTTESNTVGVSPAQAIYDLAPSGFDDIATPSNQTGLSAADIAATQGEFDRQGDALLAL